MPKGVSGLIRAAGFSEITTLFIPGDEGQSVEIQIVFDYVDPGSYLTWALLEAMEGEGFREDGLPILWIPLELRPHPRPLQDPGEEGWVAMTEALAGVAAHFGIEMKVPTFVPRTRKAHELALMAAEKGCFEEAHRAIFRAHFVEGKDIGRIDTLVALGVGAGMERSEVHTVLGVDRFLPELDRRREECRAREVRGVPTLLLGTNRLEGFHGVDELRTFLGHER